MAEHPILMDSKKFNILVKKPGQTQPTEKRESVVENAPEVSEGKKSVAQRLSKYAFGEEVAEPAKYVWTSYLEPTGKRVANDILEYFLQMIKHSFQRWIWNGKTLDDGKWKDRTSFTNYYGQQSEPIKASVMMSPVKELTFGTQADAEKVLAELKGIIEHEGGAVTVREYYETSGCPQLCESGVSSSSGWTNLSKAEVKAQPDGSGFIISLPRPISLSKTK